MGRWPREVLRLCACSASWCGLLRERGEGPRSDVRATRSIGVRVSEHIAISDDPTRVECSCGKSFEGPKARADMGWHFQLERARAALRGEGNDGS